MELKPIWMISDEHAIEAARNTGYIFNTVTHTDWGLIVHGGIFPFCIRYVGDSVDMGLAGILTPNMDRVVDCLRAMGYDLRTAQPDSEGVTAGHVNHIAQKNT
jgi:hypothetical protein